MKQEQSWKSRRQCFSLCMESGALVHHCQDMIVFLGCKHMLPAHVQFSIHWYLPALLLRTALNPIIIILVSALSQVQDLTLVELRGVPTGPRRPNWLFHTAPRRAQSPAGAHRAVHICHQRSDWRGSGYSCSCVSSQGSICKMREGKKKSLLTGVLKTFHLSLSLWEKRSCGLTPQGCTGTPKTLALSLAVLRVFSVWEKIWSSFLACLLKALQLLWFEIVPVKLGMFG